MKKLKIIADPENCYLPHTHYDIFSNNQNNAFVIDDEIFNYFGHLFTSLIIIELSRMCLNGRIGKVREIARNLT